MRRVLEFNPNSLLDIATGTGDLALTLASQLPETKITGIDLSEKMLAIGRDKVAKKNLSDRINLLYGDALALTFLPNSFDCVTIAYGIRNFESIEKGLEEVHRVLCPGGLLAILELSEPSNPISYQLYRLYSRGIIPIVGRIISKDKRAYSYLPESIHAVPQRKNMTDLMEKSGFVETCYEPMTLGCCTIYTGIKK